MLFGHAFVLTFVICEITANREIADFVSSTYKNYVSTAKRIDFLNELTELREDLVKVQVYYECMCPHCKHFFTQQLVPITQTLGSYINVSIYPYGNAQTYEDDGHYEFQCQHGPEECYGNKLHSCAIDILQDITNAIKFNSCMMDQGLGSDDRSAEKCGYNLRIKNVITIKQCAKSDKGTQLLKHYGDKSKEANFQHVPYILVNGKISNSSALKNDICSAIKNPPQDCQTYNL